MEWELEIKFKLFGYAIARKKDKFYSGGKRWYFLWTTKEGAWTHK